MANEDGYTSIGFPAIGAGALEYPVDVVAKYMYDTVNTFAKNRPNCIMSVNLVLYDEETFNVYRNEHMKRLLTAELISLEKNIEKAKLEQKKSDDKGSWPLTFTIYGFSLRDIYNAKKGLNRVIEGQNKTEEHHDRLMSVTADKEVIMDTEFSTIIKSHEDDYRRESDGAAVAFKDYQRDVNDGLQKEKTAYLKKDKEDKLEVLTKEKSPGDRGISKWPQEWEDQGTRNLKAFRLLNSSLEYKTVENKFIESVFSGRPEWSAQFNKQTFKVTKIERVQNVSLYDMYKMEKALLEEQNPECTKNELELWHGTPNKTVNMINSYGFKQFHKATKELKWDEGVFFTADASHAAMKGLRTGYAADEQCIYMCKVLTGVHCKWVIGMLELPFRQDGTILKFNSAKDDKYDPVAEYIIFNFKQAYPQYCIKFKY
ncbi:protein mono-ADP-ribosyltransferase PARP9-like [Mytilus galloprovincialis]|uniref:protein mono-ADP-ribosyltransferase PARP9-like n=1 Tax=Mytilus galloprovincialis TaxID=29158 RepID=UPI003F7CBC4F